MKKRTKNRIITALVVTTIILIGVSLIWYFKMPITTYLRQSAYAPDVCYMSVDGVCQQATIPCDTPYINFYLTLEGCQKAHPGGVEIYYRLQNNQCEPIILYPSQKTVSDFNTLPECQSKITIVVPSYDTQVPIVPTPTYYEKKSIVPFVLISVIFIIILSGTVAIIIMLKRRVKKRKRRKK